MNAKKTYHVVKNPSGGWSVKREAATRASSTHTTQEKAINAAHQISKKQGSRVIVHNQDGRVKRH